MKNGVLIDVAMMINQYHTTISILRGRWCIEEQDGVTCRSIYQRGTRGGGGGGGGVTAFTPPVCREINYKYQGRI